jgi:hypothetical protein
MEASAGKSSCSVADERWVWVGGERRGWDRRQQRLGRLGGGGMVVVGVGKKEMKGIEADASGASETMGGHVSRVRLWALTRLRLGCVWTVEMRRTIQIDFSKAIRGRLLRVTSLAIISELTAPP